MIARAALVLGVALALAAPARAADLTAGATCYPSGARIALGGSGFTANTTVTVAGAAGSPATDPSGRFQAMVTAPTVRGLAPRLLHLGAMDPTGLAASVDVFVVAPFATNAPLAGPPRERVRWRFAGFLEPGPIFGHLRTGGRTIATYRFGTPQPPCGTLEVRAPRLPVRPTPGRWRLKLDQERAYRAGASGRVIAFRVRR